jgi:HD-like signal output (HDOD) protein
MSVSPIPMKLAMVSRNRNDPGYGEGNVELDSDDEVFIDESELSERLLATFKDPSYEPPRLPAVATQLLELSGRPDVSFDQLTDVLEQDALLAGRVIQVAQSPLYSPQKSIPSLKGAVSRLGINALRDIVIQVALNMRVFRCEPYADTMDRLRVHSVATGHLARLICKYSSFEGEYAFLCGLLHDAGIAGSLIGLAEDSSTAPPDLIAVWPALDTMHAAASEVMTGLWELPAEIRMVVGAHQQVLIEGYAHPLAAIVCVANELAHDLGFGVLPGEDEGLESACLSSHVNADRATPATLKHAYEAIGLSEAQLELVRTEAAKLAENLASQ